MKKTHKVTLPNDFERMIPEYHKGSIIYGEHLVRYRAARSLVKGKVALDIASGSGYGTQLLSRAAKKMIGVDISAESIAYAKAHFGADNVEYKVGDGVSIPLEDASVDVVVSFETIEHVEDYKKFLSEVKRVLKPDGTLVLSTPNELEFAEGNHFHLHEFEYDELKSLAGQYFRHTDEYFQGTWLYSALGKRNLLEKEQEIILPTLQLSPLKPEQFLYFFLVCSDRPVTQEIQNLGAISEHWSDRKLQEKARLTQQHINNLAASITELDRVAKEQQKALVLKDNHIRNIEAQLASIKNSRIWKAAQKIREIAKR